MEQPSPSSYICFPVTLQPSKDDGSNRKINIVPCPPLSYDRVMEGQSPRSNSLLFKLPFEILGQILEHVEPTSLPSLALVNRDCRQLARSRQFASIVLDCSQSSLDLAKQLVAENQEIKANGATLSPSLGVCVRYIKVMNITGPFDNMRKRQGLQAIESHGWTYFQVVQQLLCNRRLLPHLQELDLHNVGGLSHSFFKNLTRSSIQHLKLDVLPDDDLTIGSSDKVSIPWPLRTLSLDITSRWIGDEDSTIPLAMSILRRCASTLESFRWNDVRCISNGPEGWGCCLKTGLNPVPCFTRLRNLNLCNRDFRNYSMLDAFLHHDSSRLGVRTHIGPEYANFFRTRGSIPSLRVFRFGNSLTGQLFRFLRANTHLRMLSFDVPHPAAILDMQLIPLLSNSFSRLTSLRLFWDEDVISESALEMIGSLRSLQQIHLSAGPPQHDWDHNFQIDHKAMRRHLQKLKVLKDLAFSFDTYSNGLSPLHYYHQDIIDPADPLARRNAWEPKHRTRMLAEAYEYGLLMPQLEWLFLGQIPVGFKEVPSTDAGTVRVPIALATQRDQDWATIVDRFSEVYKLPSENWAKDSHQIQ